MLKEFRKSRDERSYQDWMTRHPQGFVANCCSGYPRGYMLHRATCPTLLRHLDKNPTKNSTAKVWASTEDELDVNAEWHLPRCGFCMKVSEPEVNNYVERESHEVVQGGQFESNRRRH
jgi:hypothetical protein